jgi:hypothetical protein
MTRGFALHESAARPSEFRELDQYPGQTPAFVAATRKS